MTTTSVQESQIRVRDDVSAGLTTEAMAASCKDCQVALKQDWYTEPAQPVDVDLKIISKQSGLSDNRKAEHKKLREQKRDEIVKLTSALRNSGGGVVLVHFKGLDKKDRNLHFFNELVDYRLEKLLEDGSLFVENYHKAWPVDATDDHLFAKAHEFLLLTVKGSSVISTYDFKTKVATDESVYSPSLLCVFKRVYQVREAGTPRNVPVIKGLALNIIEESRSVQLKAFKNNPFVNRIQGDNIQLFVDYIWKDLRLREYISTFSTVANGGSYYLGVEEIDVNLNYTSKKNYVSGIRLDPTLIPSLTKSLKRKVKDNILIYPAAPTDNLVKIEFHRVVAAGFCCVLEVAVCQVHGCVFYDEKGPEAFVVKNNELERIPFDRWLTQTSMEELTGWKSTLPFMPVLKQAKGSIQNIERKYLPSGKLTIISSKDPTSSRLIPLLHQVFTNTEGLAILSSSIASMLNIEIDTISNHVLILLQPDFPLMAVCVVTKSADNNKSLKQYITNLTKEVTYKLRKFTDVHFNAVHGVLVTEDLASADMLKQALDSIVQQRSRFYHPSALVMGKEKYRRLGVAMLASIAVTDLYGILGRCADLDEPRLYFVSLEQFRTLIDALQSRESPYTAHIDTSEQGTEMGIGLDGCSLMVLEIAKRLNIVGPTLACVDVQQWQLDILRKKDIVSKVIHPSEIGTDTTDLDTIKAVVTVNISSNNMVEMKRRCQSSGCIIKIQSTDEQLCCKDTIVENTDSAINQQMDTFIKPTCFERCVELLQEKKILIIIGASGDGKTTLGRALCRQFRDLEQWTPVVIRKPEELKLFDGSREKTLVFLDDLLGQTNVSMKNVHKWKESKIFKNVDFSNCMFIVTTKREFLNEGKTLLNEILDVSKSLKKARDGNAPKHPTASTRFPATGIKVVQTLSSTMEGLLGARTEVSGTHALFRRKR